jgi:hypothetical protein
MPFTRDPVRMSGVLRGNNERAECTVSAVRVTLEGTRLTKDCMYSIDWVSALLPLGNYKLSVEGKIVEMLHSKDGWRAIQP